MTMQKNVQDVFSVTPLQAGMLFHDLNAPDTPTYLQQYAFRVTGVASVSRFIYSWMYAFRRHPALRTSFHWEGLSKPLQAVHKQIRFPLAYKDLRTFSTDDQNRFLAEFLALDRQNRFSLSNAPLVRLGVHRLDGQSVHMLLSMHHIISDGWSLRLLFSDFARAYMDKNAPKSQAPSMRPYVEYLLGRDTDKAREWWNGYLKDAEPTPLPSFGGEKGRETGASHSRREEITLTPSEADQLSSAAQAMGVTLNTLFQAAWGMTLSALTGRSEALFATSIASRPYDVPGVEDIHGPLLSIVPFRARFTGRTVKEMLTVLHGDMLEAMEHAHLPVTELSRMATGDADGGFLNSMTVFENFPSGGGEDFPLTFEARRDFESTSYPLTVLGIPDDGALRIALAYDAGLYGRNEARRLLGALRETLFGLCGADRAPRDLLAALRPDAGITTAVIHGPRVDFSFQDPWSRFSTLAAEKSEATALVFTQAQQREARNEETAARGSLAQRAETIARRLYASGFGRGGVAGVRLGPGMDRTASLLAVWRLGGAFVPAPPEYPLHHAKSILQDAGATHILAASRFWPAGDGNGPQFVDLDEQPDESGLPPLPGHVPAGPRDTAFLLFTSGSTGRSKGIRLSHGALDNRLQWMWRVFPWREGEAAIAKTTMAFADFAWELFGALFAGVPVVIPGTDEARDPAGLFAAIERYGATRLVITPTMLKAAESMGLLAAHCDGLHILTCSGEELPPALAASVLESLPRTRLLNLYGCSELMADATWYEILPGKRAEWAQGVPLGAPLDNVTLAVVDGNGLPAAEGVVGELAVSGACLADGYCNNDELTRQVFQPLPALGSRDTSWFLTGDVVRLESEGLLRFFGRKDRQIKVRGIRVEPEEIAAQLAEHDIVKEALVCPRKDAKGQQRLAAYVIPDMDQVARLAGSGSALSNRWRDAYDEAYARIEANGNFTDDYYIWQSTYTGEPIPREEMRECMDETLRSIAALAPENVLEVGFGQGFLTLPLARSCQRYVGVDNSRRALAAMASALGTAEQDGLVRRDNIDLYYGKADDLPDMDGQPFDTVVFNSVLQYFPHYRYLLAALKNVITKTAPGGRVYLGDVRNFSANPMFRLSLLLHNLDTDPDAAAPGLAEAWDRLAIEAHGEKELLIAPELFCRLPEFFDRVSGVAVSPKRGEADNELTAFRYEAVLYLDEPGGRAATGDEIVWKGEAGDALTGKIRQALAGRNDLTVREIANRRVQAMALLHQALEDRAHTEGGTSLDALRKEIGSTVSGYTREELHQLAESAGAEADVFFSANGIALDAVFRPAGSAAVRQPAPLHAPLRPLDELTNTPNDAQTASALRAVLGDHLAERLIEAKRPETYLFFDHWPKTITGKIDMKRLPNPFLLNKERDGEAPDTDTERELAAVWTQILGQDGISRDDDFFALGGNSLSVTQLAFSLRKRFALDIAFRDLYQVPRLRDMAAHLDRLRERKDEELDNPFFLDIPEDMLERDIASADDVVPLEETEPRPLSPGMRILFTGVPSAISLWLLGDILTTGDYSVVCLEDAPGSQFGGQADPLGSLRQRLLEIGLWRPEFAQRLATVPGHLGAERFGLGQRDWESLAANVDAVVHSGVNMNLAQTYQYLHPVNIEGTRQCLRFCCEGRLKPVHYQSSLAVIDQIFVEDDAAPFKEDMEYTSYKGMPGGYLLTRWASERMMWRAMRRGIPVAIYRYAPVSGDLRSHLCDRTEMYWRYLRLYCQTNVTPIAKRNVNILPADVSAEAVRLLAEDPACYGHAHHICNPVSEPSSIWGDYLERLGYPIRRMEPQAWFDFLTSRPDDFYDDNARMLLAFFGKDGRDPIKGVQFDMTNTLRLLKKTGLTIPRFSFELFAKYYEVLVREGWLPAPDGRQAKAPLPPITPASPVTDNKGAKAHA